MPERAELRSRRALSPILFQSQPALSRARAHFLFSRREHYVLHTYHIVTTGWLDVSRGDCPCNDNSRPSRGDGSCRGRSSNDNSVSPHGVQIENLPRLSATVSLPKFRPDIPSNRLSPVGSLFVNLSFLSIYRTPPEAGNESRSCHTQQRRQRRLIAYETARTAPRGVTRDFCLRRVSPFNPRIDFRCI